MASHDLERSAPLADSVLELRDGALSVVFTGDAAKTRGAAHG